MKIKYMILSLLMLVGAVSSAQDNELASQFEQDLKSKNEDVTAIRCDFVQTREMSVLEMSVAKEGEFSFQRPGNMLLSFDDGDYIKMSETMFEMKTADNVSSTSIASNPMLKNLSSILSACVIGDFKQMTKGFEVTLLPTETEWQVTMIPVRGKAASKISQIILHFDRSDMSLNLLKMIEKSGDFTMYEFSNKQFNVNFDTIWF